MYKKEKDLQAAVKKAIIENYGSDVWYFHPRTSTEKGLPDIVLCFYGIFVAIELKKDISIYGLTKLQEYTLNRIVASKGFSIVADSVPKVIYCLEKIKKYNLTSATVAL